MSGTGSKSLLAASVWHRPLVPEEAKDRLAKRKANAAVALLRLGHEPEVWPLLKHGPDPRTRSYLIHGFRLLEANPKQVLSQLDGQEDVSIRRSLLLILGEFSEQQLPLEERARIVPRLLDLYSNDPDPGIHGAVGWTLRQWGRQAELEKIDLELATGVVAGKRRWFVNRQGQTLIIIPAPGEIVIGSPAWETGREDGPEGEGERQRYVRIDHSFAVMACQVTVMEFFRFRREFHYRRSFSPEPRCPINSVSWYEAAAYCNWLNEQEGIPTEQWCYLPNDQGEYSQGMKIVPECLQRCGYRLPTEAEWEYACRADSITSRYYGQNADLDNYFTWNLQNSMSRCTFPVGGFKPNDWGLFDMLGNLMDWCHDEAYDATRSVADKLKNCNSLQSTVDDMQRRISLGAPMIAKSANVRSAYRYSSMAPNLVNNYWGLRLSKTYLSGTESESAVRNDQLRKLRGPGVAQHFDRGRTAYNHEFSPNAGTHFFSIRAARTMD